MADQQEVGMFNEDSASASTSAATGTDRIDSGGASFATGQDGTTTNADERKRKGESSAHPMMPAPKKVHTGSTSDMQPRQIPIHSQMRQFLAPNGGLAYSADMDSFRKLMKKEQLFDNQAFFTNVLLKTNNQTMLDAFVRSEGLLVTRSWLLRARKENNDKLMKKLFELYHHLPMNIETLKDSQIGKITRHISVNYNSDEIKQLASTLISAWSKSFPQLSSGAPSRTTPEPTPVPIASNATDSITDITAITPDTIRPMDMTPAITTAAEKAAVRRPVITRRTEANVETAVANSAGINVTSPAIKKPEGNTPIISILKQTRAEVFSEGMPELAPVNTKPKKNVRFLPDEQLVSIREIEFHPNERAYTGRIPDGQGGHIPNPRALDVAEGKIVFQERSMHLRPTGVWRTPIELELTIELPFGRDSMEKNIQSERERSTLAALYGSPDMIPDSPAEPASETASTNMDVDYTDNLIGNGPTPKTISWAMLEDMNTVCC
ncbi:hypothetical protein BDF19DRAFT_454680 [Syncephalis fuscata]|nr:hypothetical protein BDF19DRAFT_454680 [Syncephalis fuscata]